MKNRIVSLILTIFSACSVLLGTVYAGAAADATFGINARKGNVSISSVSPGEKMSIYISTQNIKTISSLQMKISYNPSAFVFAQNSVECLITDSEGVAQYACDSSNGTITIIWDTTNSNTVINGDIFKLLFTAETVSKNINSIFKVVSVAVYDSSNKKITSDTSNASIEVGVNAIVFEEEELAAFRKLEIIKYPDSKADIDAAKTIFGGYSNDKIKAFYNTYTDLYEYYRTALTRYYRLQENAGYAEIDKEIAAFTAKYSRILAIQEGKVTLNDKAEIAAASDELGAMSNAVLARVDNSVKEKIKKLQSEIKQLEADARKYSKAVQEYEEFKENFKTVLGATENDVAGNYKEYGSMVVEAIASYDLMSETAQTLGQSERKLLSELMGYVNKYTAEDEAEQALLEKQQEFLKKHAKVLEINQRNVTVYDKTAIELTIADIDAQPDELREKLQMRRNLLQKLLDKIATLAVQTDGSGSNSSSSAEIAKPAAENTNIGNNNDKNSETAQVRVDTDTSEVKTDTKTVISEAPQIILVLCLILAGSVLMLAFPAILAWQYIKQKKYEQIGGEIL